MESFDQLLAGELDVAVRSREALPHGLRFEPLFASDRMLIVPRGHELAGKKRPTLRDLARHAFVIPAARSRWRREAGCPWAGDAGGYRRLIRNGRRDAVAGGGGEEGGVEEALWPRRRIPPVRTFPAVVEKSPETGLFVGYVPGFPGAHSQGETLEELNENLKEVVQMLLEDGEPAISTAFIGIYTVQVA